MTREEKINTLKAIIQECEEYQWQRKEILFEIIKDLEQEPVIDKIRAEIEQNAYPIVHGINNHELGMTVYGILQVIDKYKAEVEPQESGR